jgi:hypothetical protein
MYLSSFGLSVSRRAIGQLLGRPHRRVHEVPIDHLPPVGGHTVTPLAERRRELEALRFQGRRSG